MLHASLQSIGGEGRSSATHQCKGVNQQLTWSAMMAKFALNKLLGDGGREKLDRQALWSRGSIVQRLKGNNVQALLTSTHELCDKDGRLELVLTTRPPLSCL